MFSTGYIKVRGIDENTQPFFLTNTIPEMNRTLLRFLNIITTALVAGTIFGIWIGYNPSDLSAPTFIEQQQSAIASLNLLMPILGLLTIMLTLVSAFLHKKEKNVFIMMLIATILLVVSGLTTRFGNQPINAIVMTWDMNAPPDNWTALRDQWWSYHIVRTVTACLGLCLVVWSGIRKD